MPVPRHTPVEPLEPRRLLAATLSLNDGVLWVLGDDAGNTINVGYTDATASRIRVVVNGTQIGRVRARNVDLVALEGGAGDDFLQVDQSIQVFAKTTLMVGWAGDDTFHGGDEADCVLGGAGDDNLDGGAGDDFLFGFTGADTISGHDGNDLIAGVPDTVANLLSGGDGDDTIFAFRGPTASGAVDTITGGNGNDAIAYDLLGNVDGGPGTDAGFPVTGSTATPTSVESTSSRGWVHLRRVLGYTIDTEILDVFHIHKWSLKLQF